MNIITGDLNVLEQECKLLMNELCKKNNQTRQIALISSLDILSELYTDVTGSKNRTIEKYKKNTYLYNEVMKKQRIQANQFTNNFIENKEFHNSFINDLLYNTNSRLDSLSSIEANTVFSEKEMYDIMMEYLSTKGMDKYLDDIINEKRIFKGLSSEFYAGYMAFNVVDKIPHILIDNEINSVEKMTSIVHEIGHIYDYLELYKIVDLKAVNDYYMKSIYSEVISKQTEKDFITFLLKNNIATKDACCMLEDYYLDINGNLGDLLILTGLEDNLLRREKYRNLDAYDIIDKIVGKSSITYIDEDLFEPNNLDIFKSLAYGYSGIIATYFEGLKQENMDKYECHYENFLKSRAHMFNISNLLSFIEDCEEASNVFTRQMDRDVKIKQKIYHEN